MADDDPQRQRLEDMLKASEQRRKPGPGPREEAGGEAAPPKRPSGGSPGSEPPDEAPDGGRPPRATGTAATQVKTGLVLGPLGILVGFLLSPIVGLLLGIAAIVLGVMVARKTTDVRAKIAVGLGILGVIASIVSFVIVLSASEEGGNGGDDSEESDDEGGSDSGGEDGDSDGGDGDSDGGDGGGDSDGGDDSSSLRHHRVLAGTRAGDWCLRPA